MHLDGLGVEYGWADGIMFQDSSSGCRDSTSGGDQLCGVARAGECGEFYGAWGHRGVVGMKERGYKVGRRRAAR